ncbi:MAG: A/G-specific adenine glycosylase [Planctomycetota bacterium]
MDEKALRETGERLILWYRAHRRDLPWRRKRTPYRVWVSEVMLQQTAVSTVIPYFERWVERFPGVRALAAAEEREALAQWEGLGYYQRARRLHSAARKVVEEHDGRIPRRESDLRELPGVGPYIAAAILSFAFGEDKVALDANVVRVFMRLLAIHGTGSEAAVRRRVGSAAASAMPPGRSADYNQALMDFGSAICLPRSPRCGECFVTDRCRAFAAGEQYDIPEPRPKRLKDIRTAIAVFRREGRVYIQKRPDDGLFAGMWEFPGGKVRDGERPAEAAVRECREEVGVACTVDEKLTELTHYYTVFRVRLHAFLCSPDGRPPEDRTHRWVAVSKLERYPMPSANRQVVQALNRR